MVVALLVPIIVAIVGILGAGLAFGADFALPIGLIAFGIILLIFFPLLFVTIPWYIWAVGILVVVISMVGKGK